MCFFLALVHLQVCMCAYGRIDLFSHKFYLMPRAQLFEVDGINPPRRISKLSLRYRRSIAALKKDNMPPRRPPSGRTTVNQNHPAATAAAAARVVAVNQNHPAATAAAAARVVAAGEINGVNFSAPATRESPSRHSKTVANEKISEMCHHNPRVAIAVGSCYGRCHG